MQKGLQEKITLTIVHAHKIQLLAVDAIYRQNSIHQIIQLISNKIGYSSHIFPYTLPIGSFSTLKHINPQQTLKSCLQQYPNLCFTYNNTQFNEQSYSKNKQRAFFGLGKNPIVIVLQICQNNAFVNEKYNIPQNYDINSIKAIASRYGRSMFVQFQTMRISLDRFGIKQKISECLKQLIDEHNRLLLYVSDFEQRTQIITIKGELKVHSMYVEMHMEGYQERFILFKETNWKIAKYLLQLIFQTELYVLNPTSNQFIRLTQNFKLSQNQQMLVMKKAQSAFISLKNPMEHSYLLGHKGKLLYILSKSNMLHIYQYSHQIIPKSTIILHKTESEIDDEDIGFIEKNQIIMYNISVYYIAVSFFTLNGQFLFTKRHPWNKDYLVQFDLQNSVIDILLVKLKSKKQQYSHFFYVTNPENYIEIHTPQQISFYPAKVGLNKFSDGSGHIAITINSRKTSFYWLSKSQIQICYLQHLQRPTKIIFSIWDKNNSKRKIAVFYQRHIDILIINFQVKTIQFVAKIQNMSKNTKNIHFLFGFNNQLTIFDVATMRKDNQSIRIGQGTILINKAEGHEILAMMKENPYLLRYITGFYQIQT